MTWLVGSSVEKVGTVTDLKTQEMVVEDCSWSDVMSRLMGLLGQVRNKSSSLKVAATSRAPACSAVVTCRYVRRRAMSTGLQVAQVNECELPEVLTRA